MGRDMWSRIVYGARISLAVGVGSTGLGCLFGVTIGLMSGYFGGWYDLIVQRIMDMMQSLPLLVMALVMTAALGPSLTNTIIAISIPLVPTVARVIRSNTLMLREMPFVEAARAVGMNEFSIALRHVLPNTLAPLIVLATAQLGSTILVEAALSFLGLGVPEPHPSWGRMLSESAAEYVRVAPWLVIFPGAAISSRCSAPTCWAMRCATSSIRASATDACWNASRSTHRRPARCRGPATYFFLRHGILKAVDGVSFQLQAARDAGDRRRIRLRQVDDRALADAARSRSAGQDRRRLGQARRPRPVALDEAAMRRVRGKDISMIFQEPMTSLNPVMTIGSQIAEALLLHEDLSSRGDAMRRAVEILRLVRIPEPEQRLQEYPHQLSGGMRQRAMIAMALACNPKVLLADEPTTALDVTIQAQILDIILDLQKKLGTAVILITHDLGVVAETAQRVIVMYAGRKVEEAPVDELFARPLHPYTHGLMASIPRLGLMRGGAGETKQAAAGNSRHRSGADQPAGRAASSRRAARIAIDRAAREFPPYEEKRPAIGRRAGARDELYGAAPWPEPRPPVLEVTDLKKHFPIKKGLLRRTDRPRLRGRRRQLHNPRGRNARAGRRVRLRQVHGRPHHPAADRADRRQHQDQRHRHHASRQGGAAPAIAGRCRSSSRTRSPRSIRACPRATSSASRCACTASATRRSGARASPTSSSASACAPRC